MIVNVSVAVSRLIDECNIQTSLDLQAMRARGVEGADAVYDDWIITKDNGEQIYYALQDHTARETKYIHRYRFISGPPRWAEP